MTGAIHAVRRAPGRSAEPIRRTATPPRAAAVPRYMAAGTLAVGAVHDPEEHQAEAAAKAVAAGGSAHAVLDGGARHDYPKLDAVRRRGGAACGCEACREGAYQGGVRDTATLRRATAGGMAQAEAPSGAELATAAGGGPMAPGLRRTMEGRFGADFSGVRLHTGAEAAHLSARIGARAFAYGGDVFFGRDQFRPDTSDGVHLIAHELTHTIQQGAAPLSAPAPARRSPEPRLQRSPWPSLDPLGFMAEQANMLPGFRMLTLVVGFNPVTMQPVGWSLGGVLRAVIELAPAGGLVVKALDQYGVIDRAASWLGEQIATLGITAEAIKGDVKRFIGTVDVTDFASPGDVWERAKRIFNDPIERIKAFARTVADGVIRFVKDAVLRPLAGLAAQTRAWDLLIALLGRNPITGDPVPQTAETLIGGFMKLIGQEEIWDNLKKANGVARAMAWFQKSKAALLAFVAELPGVFMATLTSFGIGDLLDLPGALGKVRTGFGDFAARFFSWAGTAAWDLLEIIFDVVSPGALSYIKKTGAALKGILKDPLPFVGNLVKAAKLGLSNFADHVGTHLKAGLIDWLTGSLPGVYIPQALSLVELGKFALSVLGIGWAQIRAKIVKALGPKGETIMVALETTFDVVVALVRGGPAAAWELIKDKLTGLKDQVVSGIIGFVTDAIVKKAIPKLVAMFIPGAGFISAVLSIYDTVMVFVQKLSKIAAVVRSFVDSIVAIAGGQIGGAASRVEGALAGLLSLAISFLAGFVGLGKVSDKIMGAIQPVRGSVDKGLDASITWLVGRAKAQFAALFGGKDKDGKDGRTEGEKASARTEEPVVIGTESHVVRAELTPEGVTVTMASNSFGDFAQRLDEITSKNKSELQKMHLESVLKMLSQEITAIKALTPQGKLDAFQTGVDKGKAQNKMRDFVQVIVARLRALGVKYTFGAGQNAAVGDTVLLDPGAVGATVQEVGVAVGPTIGVRIRHPSGAINIKPYDMHGIPGGWTLVTPGMKPAYVKFSGSAGAGVREVKGVDRLYPPGNSGASANPPRLNQVSRLNPAVLTNIRGHLVAQQFGGPGDSRNIVAVTTRTNGASGMGMIERQAHDAIVNKGYIVDYSAIPQYSLPPATEAPDSIAVTFSLRDVTGKAVPGGGSATVANN